MTLAIAEHVSAVAIGLVTFGATRSSHASTAWQTTDAPSTAWLALLTLHKGYKAASDLKHTFEPLHMLTAQALMMLACQGVSTPIERTQQATTAGDKPQTFRPNENEGGLSVLQSAQSHITE